MGKSLAGISFYSFWKPDLIPSGQISVAKLLPFGRYHEVIWRLGNLPRIGQQADICGFDQKVVRLTWGSGVVLQVHSEDGFVYSVEAISRVGDEELYRLYVMLFEAFNCLCYDEGLCDFVNLSEFRARVKSS